MKHYSSSGSIRKRTDGRWEGRYIDLDGSRHSVYGRTKSEVQRQIINILHGVQKGNLGFAPIISTADFSDQWLKHVATTIRPKTLMTYTYIVNVHIKPFLGDIPLHNLTVVRVQELLNNVRADGLSPRSVAHIRAVLRTALNQAMRWDLVPRNVASLTTPPKLDQSQINPLDVVESRIVLAGVNNTHLEPIITIAMVLGLRQGEILGLRWSDIDFETRYLHVRNTLQRIDGKYLLAETKTVKSQRMLALPNMVVQSLKIQKQRQEEYRLIARNEWYEEIPNLVFTSCTGSPLHGSTVNHQFHKLLDRCNLPRRSFHSLRHTAATLALGQGVDLKTVSTMLGHSQISLTANTYATTLPSLLVEAANKLDQLLGEE